MSRGESAYCGACGARIDAAVRFCASCGESQAQLFEPDGVGGEGDSAANAAAEMFAAAVPVPPPPAGKRRFYHWDEEPGAREDPVPGDGVLASRLSVADGGDRPAKEQRATGIIIVGYICAVLLPLVGAIIGALQYERNRHGIWIIVVSIAMVVLSIVVTLVLVAMVNSSLSGLTEFDWGAADSAKRAAPTDSYEAIGLGGEEGAADSAKRAAPTSYVVQNGDTLTAISARTGVSVSRIEALNPGVDPQILVSGEKLKLR